MNINSFIEEVKKFNKTFYNCEDPDHITYEKEIFELI